MKIQVFKCWDCLHDIIGDEIIDESAFVLIKLGFKKILNWSLWLMLGSKSLRLIYIYIYIYIYKRKNSIGRRLTTTWLEKCGRITKLLGKIEFKLCYLKKNIKILFFIILTCNFLYEPGCVISSTRPKNKSLEGYLECLYLAHDVWVFLEDSLVQRTRPRRFMVLWPRTLVNPFYLFHMQNGW